MLARESVADWGIMGRLTLLGLAIIGLIALGFATLEGRVIALALPLVLYLGVALGSRPDRPELAIERTQSADRVHPDRPVDIRLTICNTGSELAELHLWDQLPSRLSIVDGHADIWTSLGSGDCVELGYTLRGDRGDHYVPGIVAEVRDPFGLFQQIEQIRAPARLLVLPTLRRLRHLSIRPQQTRLFAGPIPARQGGPGVEFHGVRPYQPGDPKRWIHERASARHPDQLFTREFEQERMADIGLILDARRARQRIGADLSLFERSVEACAALAQAWIAEGHRVGLLIYGRHIERTPPGYGKVQRERIWRALAQARIGDHPLFAELENLPTRLFPARSQLILVSPLAPDDLPTLRTLRARGYALSCVAPDPIRIERTRLATNGHVDMAATLLRTERRLLLRRLRALGIHVVDWDVEMPLEQAVHRAWRRGPLRAVPQRREEP